MGKEKEKVGTIDKEGIRRQMGLGAKKGKERKRDRKEEGGNRKDDLPSVFVQ